MGELVFVGLGLGDKGLSLAGIDAIRRSHVAYLEHYTSPPSARLQERVENATGKRLQLIDRASVEGGDRVLNDAMDSNVVLAVQGDPMIATTHSDLRVRAMELGIRTSIIHGAAIPAAAASESGLHYYKFGATITFTLQSATHHREVYQRVHSNLLDGLHTLILLEYDVERGEGALPRFVVDRLLHAEANYKQDVLSERTFVIVLSRIGSENQSVQGYEMAKLLQRDDASFGQPPHCLVIPGKLHFTETEALGSVINLPNGAQLPDNTTSIRRTAQTLLPRYVEKAKKALSQAREALGSRHAELLENAELYLRDAENFLANNQDELAMLSIGYAEGLVDALSFTGEVKLDW